MCEMIPPADGLCAEEHAGRLRREGGEQRAKSKEEQAHWAIFSVVRVLTAIESVADDCEHEGNSEKKMESSDHN